MRTPPYIVKVAKDKHRSHFYCSVTERYDTKLDFDNLAECMAATLKLQAIYEKKYSSAASGNTAADFRR